MLRTWRFLRGLLVALLFALPARAAGQLEVHFIDVGQGDSILVRSPGGKTVLIDAGNTEAGGAVSGYLDRLGVGALDLVIVSHPHLDHMGGMLEVLKAHPPKSYLDPAYAHPLENYDALLDWLESQQIPVKVGRAGRTIQVEPGVTLELLSPTEPLLDGTRSDANSNSVVARLVYGKTSFLFTGDSENETEERMLSGEGELSATVLKVAHHGGRYSTSDRWLARVEPKFAVISCGAINTYGHPSKPTLDRLEGHQVQVFRTDRDGDVIARTDGTTLTWETTGERSAKLDEKGGRRSFSKDGERTHESHSEARSEPAHGLVDLNTATEQELESLPGISAVKAKEIVADRVQKGPYPDLDALLRVRGIGHGIVERIRPQVTVVLPDQLEKKALPERAAVRVVEKAPPATPAPRPMAQPGLAFRQTARMPPPPASDLNQHGFGTRLLAPPQHVRVNVNLADAAALARAADISVEDARRIVAHRGAHGAFHKLAEVEQIEGLEPGTAAALERCCAVRIELNRASQADLLALGFHDDEAHAIVARRAASGRFLSIDDLEEVDELSPERRAKFLPLLTVDRSN